MKSKLFTASQFVPTIFSTGEDKAKFANQFVDFVKSNFSHTKFPKWFYQKLSNCFGMIAIYNEHSFFAYYFVDNNGKRNFINECLNWGCFGQPEFTYCDVERVLIQWLKDNYHAN